MRAQNETTPNNLSGTDQHALPISLRPVLPRQDLLRRLTMGTIWDVLPAAAAYSGCRKVDTAHRPHHHHAETDRTYATCPYPLAYCPKHGSKMAEPTAQSMMIPSWVDNVLRP